MLLTTLKAVRTRKALWIADGRRWLFVRHGRWRGLDCAREERGDLQMEGDNPAPLSNPFVV